MSKNDFMNSFNKSRVKKETSFNEKTTIETYNKKSFKITNSKGNEQSIKLIGKVNQQKLNPVTFIPKGNKENKENKKKKIKKENKEAYEINEIRIPLKNQNNELNPNRIIIKPRRNASVQQRKRNCKSINLNSFFPKANHQLSNPGIVGLKCEGQNCDFINSVIQCFSNIGRFRIGLLNLENNILSNKIITQSLVEVLKNLWIILNHRTYSPKNFIEIIKNNFKLNYNFKEFINFLINNIHNELKIQNNNNIKNVYQLSNDYNDNINNFHIFKNTYEIISSSIISKEFRGYTGNLDVCEQCHQNDTITFNTFKTLSFNIDDIIKHNQNNCAGIYQCFEYFERKQDNLKCTKCNNLKFIKNDLLYMPSTLIITLNYGNKTNAKLIFEEYLNLAQYVTYYKESPYYYELIGIIVKIEDNKNGNHFISYCKNNDNCLWYKYDNDIVIRTSFLEVASHVQPSVLFYSYIEVY